MVVLDTCAIIYDAFEPNRLGKAAKQAINKAEKSQTLICSDISLWEIAMLVSKDRINPGTDYLGFINTALAARGIKVEPISPEIADVAVSLPSGINADPADRIILATAQTLCATLVTCDQNLVDCGLVKTIW